MDEIYYAGNKMMTKFTINEATQEGWNSI